MDGPYKHDATACCVHLAKPQ